MTNLALLGLPVRPTRDRLNENDRITVGIVDDEVLIRTGIRSVLESAGEIAVVGEARDGSSAVNLAMAHRPRVLLVNTAMPGLDCPTVIGLVRQQVRTIRVVLLAAQHEGDLLLPVLRAGAAGFLFKNCEPGELVKAVRVVAAGGTFVCPAATMRLVEHVVSDRADRREQARRRLRGLTPREREVLDFVAKGLGNARIARVMSLSEGSIKAYVSRLLTKLRCDNRVQAALIAHDAFG
jgi:DNA-binding NarL/FixJ family response regulator